MRLYTHKNLVYYHYIYIARIYSHLQVYYQFVLATLPEFVLGLVIAT